MTVTELGLLVWAIFGMIAVVSLLRYEERTLER
jgi:hypothetical protein